MTMPGTGSRISQITAATVAACACAVVLVACGGSTKHDSANASNNYQSFLSFSKCMRSHGLTNFPDPSTQGGGIQLSVTGGSNPSAPGFQSAQHACQHLLPGGGPGSRKPTEQDKQNTLALANCMRAHGLTNFPDPTTTQPQLSGAGAAMAIDGLFFDLGATGIDPQSPAFLHAAQACHFPGAGRIGSNGHAAVVTKGG
jgi:hypothetical protein